MALLKKRSVVAALLGTLTFTGCGVSRAVQVTENPVKGTTQIVQRASYNASWICTGSDLVVLQMRIRDAASANFRMRPKLYFLIGETERFQSTDGVAVAFDAYGGGVVGTYNFGFAMRDFRRLCLASKRGEKIRTAYSHSDEVHTDQGAGPGADIHAFAAELVARGWMKAY